MDPIEISQCDDRVLEGSFQIFNSFDDVHDGDLTHDQELTFIVIEVRTRRASVTGRSLHIESEKSSFFHAFQVSIGASPSLSQFL